MKEWLDYFDEDLADVMHDGGKKMSEHKQEVKRRGKKKLRKKDIIKEILGDLFKNCVSSHIYVIFSKGKQSIINQMQ